MTKKNTKPTIEKTVSFLVGIFIIGLFIGSLIENLDLKEKNYFIPKPQKVLQQDEQELQQKIKQLREKQHQL